MSTIKINAVDAAAPDAAAAPAGFDQAVSTAISFFEKTFNPDRSVYLNIDFEYAPLKGRTVASSRSYYGTDNYKAAAADLRATDASIPADAGLLLPANDPFFFSFGTLELHVLSGGGDRVALATPTP